MSREDPMDPPPGAAPDLRRLMEARKDLLGLRLCDLDEARQAAREGRDADALAALSRALGRMAEDGSLAGLDVAASEGLALARDAGDEGLEARLGALVVATGRQDLLDAVLAGLWSSSDGLLAAGDLPRALARARAALELAVQGGDGRASATALSVLAACHEAEGRLDAMALCLQQAGRCLRLEGDAGGALALLEAAEAGWRAAGRDPEAAGARDERLEVAASGGLPGEAVALLCAQADEALALRDGRAAQRLARRALALASEGEDPGVEATAWRCLGRVQGAAGDGEGAAASEARADLLEGASR